MKPVLPLIALSALIAPAHAANVCVAELYQSISYGSYNQYIVTCDDGSTFKTKKNITTFLLPLPYAWKKTSKRILDSAMDERGMREKTSFKIQGDQKYDGDPIILFESKQKSEINTAFEYAMVFPTQPRESGLDKTVRFDAVIAFADSRPQIHLTGVTEAELKKTLDEAGFTHRIIDGKLESNYNRSYSRGISIEKFRVYTNL